MQRRTGIKFEAYILLARKAGQAPPLEAWTRFHVGVARLVGEFEGSYEPVLTRTEWHLKVEWIVRDQNQLDALLLFFERTQSELGLEELPMSYYSVVSVFFE